MKKDIDWTGFQENVEVYIRKHKGISGKMLKQLFDNYSENAVKNCTKPPITDDPLLAVSGYPIHIYKWGTEKETYCGIALSTKCISFVVSSQVKAFINDDKSKIL